MERRKFMMTTAGTLATLTLASKALADDCTMPPTEPVDPDKLSLTNKIGRNHGHAFELTLEDLILLMRVAKVEGEVLVDIQGKSGHPHSLSLNVDEIVAILADGKLQKNSTVDAGHAHAVLIELKEVVTEPEPPTQ